MKKKNEIISVLYTHIKKRKKGEKWEKKKGEKNLAKLG